MQKLPSMQFYPGDWLRDGVSGCSLAAQGLWLRLMILMHDCEPYGYLCIDNRPIESEQLARRVGCPLEEFERLLSELESAGVPSRTKSGIVFSRRMKRDGEERNKNAERQRRHYEKVKGGKPNADLTATSRRSNGNLTPTSRKPNAVSSTSISSSSSSSGLSPPSINGENELSPNNLSRRASADEKKKSRFNFKQRLEFASSNPKIKNPEAFAQSLATGEQDEKIEAFFLGQTVEQEPDFQSRLRAKITDLRAKNTGCEYSEQDLFDDLEFHFKKLGEWDELKARKIIKQIKGV